jgi:hypothetical protein
MHEWKLGWEIVSNSSGLEMLLINLFWLRDINSQVVVILWINDLHSPSLEWYTSLYKHTSSIKKSISYWIESSSKKAKYVLGKKVIDLNFFDACSINSACEVSNGVLKVHSLQ